MSLEKLWYQKTLIAALLAPLGWLFCAGAVLRRMAYRYGVLTVHELPVPVIVVGNIAIGGTGKTPAVIWLVELLRSTGFRPGLVSRGYRGGARNWPQQVRPDSDPAVVGEEAVLLARRCQCPMAVGPDRVAAARAVIEHSGANVIVSDDGLQHYALGRDIEIAVVDGVRRFGNRRCLPAGPLREPVRRMGGVDFVVCNGVPGRLEYAMQVRGDTAIHLRDPARRRGLEEFRAHPVHAVAGIGNPQRFFGHLRRFELRVIEHPYPDHHWFQPRDISFDDDGEVLMTEKDAVKCARHAGPRHWSVPVSAEIDERLGQRLLGLLRRRAAAAGGDAPAGIASN
ncbi:MAG: tetraacyldisaccharide 4'-kinase [Gammaproteobacteria bacterium]|nr:tetraacyldisaccharide 4'-kinase [Gammaproteobacteria bacterium]NIR96693.1 tetraacyldisaccharide 4'-kinase [Gammaproteobacteria bacterium]NIT62397.1 tetraacyldisaccharide 4'-kinase [Gammaproteobacteria bacterium]NIV19329.1 tetraacyldisaccharide 4'-kinase [Gammaproteobacteria bacterium]NIX10290.1 tetraacyldisaccharide 4'-kinase [Gammaproteobacteria bacterium]